jgi:hypothetical protein
VDVLRRQGVTIASIVRGAIRAEYQRRRRRAKPRDDRPVSVILAEIYRKYPDPDDVAPRTYNVHDAKEAREAIIAMLRKARK